jgi:hypothetical protein
MKHARIDVFIIGLTGGLLGFLLAILWSAPPQPTDAFEAGRFQGWRDCVRTSAKE